MTDETSRRPDTSALEKRLHNAFPAAPLLSEDFERDVIAIARRRSARPNRRTVRFVMGSYWACVGLLSAWVLAGSLGGAAGTVSPAGIGMVLAVIAIPVAGLAVITGLAHIRLSELFLGTLQGTDELSDPPAAG